MDKDNHKAWLNHIEIFKLVKENITLLSEMNKLKELKVYVDILEKLTSVSAGILK